MLTHEQSLAYIFKCIVLKDVCLHQVFKIQDSRFKKFLLSKVQAS